MVSKWALTCSAVVVSAPSIKCRLIGFTSLRFLLCCMWYAIICSADVNDKFVVMYESGLVVCLIPYVEHMCPCMLLNILSSVGPHCCDVLNV